MEVTRLDEDAVLKTVGANHPWGFESLGFRLKIEYLVQCPSG